MTARRWILLVLAVVAAALALGYLWMTRHPLEVFAMVRRHELKSAGFEPGMIEGVAEGSAESSAEGTATSPVRVFESGVGPPLILLHGVGDHAGTWADVAPAFTDRYRVIAVDLPGHGDSPPGSGPLPMATIVAGAEAVLESAANGDGAVLVGNSLGGWLASILALRHPELVERVVLVSGGGLAEQVPSLLPTNREEARELMALLRHPESPEIPDMVLDALVRRSADPTTPIARLSQDAEGLGAHLLDSTIGTMEVPADLVWGEADRLLGTAYAARMDEAIPASRLTMLEKCGHVPSVECPERLVATLSELLAAAPPEMPTAPNEIGGQADEALPGDDGKGEPETPSASDSEDPPEESGDAR